MYDVIIVGAGPAGVTAAIYAARKMMKTLVLTGNIGGQAALSPGVENYTGFQLISGLELSEKFNDHMGKFNIEIEKDTEVISIEKDVNYFNVKTADATYQSRTVISASGRRPRYLNAPGEMEYKNKGVTYCATCDAPLFEGKDVAVVGGGNAALDAALQLIPIANKIYLIDISDRIIGDAVMLEKVKSSPKVEIMLNVEVKEIFGDKFVKGLKLLVGKKEDKTLDVEGVFIEIGSMPVKEPTSQVKTNEHNEIIVNERCETNIPGLFAAGDVTNVPEKQIIVAAGQGCIACLSAFKYISRKKFKEA